MRYPLLLISAATASLATACTDDGQAAKAAGGTGGGTADAQATGGAAGKGGGGASSDGPATITIRSSVYKNAAPPSGTPFAGVKICVHDAGPCTTSASGGTWELTGVATNADVVLTFTADGYIPLARAITTGFADIDLIAEENPMLPGADDSGFWQGTAPFDPSLGSATLFAACPGARLGAFDWALDVTVQLSSGAGDGPFYTNIGTETIVSGATHTVGGVMRWINLPAGEHTFTFGDPTGTCAAFTPGNPAATATHGFPGKQPNEVRVPSIPGFLTTAVGVWCPRGAPAATLLLDAGGAPPGDSGADSAP